MLQDVVSICEKDKNIVFYDVFASGAQHKRENTIRVKDFGGSAAS